MKFYIESNFRSYQGESIPADWTTVKIMDIATVKEGIYGKRSEQGNILQLKADSIRDGKINKDAFAKITIDRDIDNYLVKAGDVLLNNRNSASLVGKSAIFQGEFSECVFGNLLTRIRLDSEDIIPEWLLYRLMQLHGTGFLMAISTRAVNQALLKKGTVEKIWLPVPPIMEQKQIIQVLSHVDSAIELADKVIAGSERLKRGLMQQLLTRGIGHTETKQTPIGNLPKEWGVDRIGNLVELRSNMSVNHFENIAFIPMELVPDQQIFAKYELRKRNDVKSATYCEAGDLLLAKITPSLENGKQGIVLSDVPNGIALATTEVFPLKCTGINKFFLFYVLKHSQFRNQIIASMIGTTGRQRASKESVERLEIPVPPPDEQQRIAEIFFEVDKKLELDTAERQRLERIKRGLMDLLLTGKIRIKVD